MDRLSLFFHSFTLELGTPNTHSQLTHPKLNNFIFSPLRLHNFSLNGFPLLSNKLKSIFPYGIIGAHQNMPTARGHQHWQIEHIRTRELVFVFSFASAAGEFFYMQFICEMNGRRTNDKPNNEFTRISMILSFRIEKKPTKNIHFPLAHTHTHSHSLHESSRQRASSTREKNGRSFFRFLGSKLSQRCEEIALLFLCDNIHVN